MTKLERDAEQPYFGIEIRRSIDRSLKKTHLIVDITKQIGGTRIAILNLTPREARDLAVMLEYYAKEIDDEKGA